MYHIFIHVDLHIYAHTVLQYHIFQLRIGLYFLCSLYRRKYPYVVKKMHVFHCRVLFDIFKWLPIKITLRLHLKKHTGKNLKILPWKYFPFKVNILYFLSFSSVVFCNLALLPTGEWILGPSFSWLYHVLLILIESFCERYSELLIQWGHWSLCKRNGIFLHVLSSNTVYWIE